MPITFDCIGCGTLLNAPKQAKGKKVRCPACQAISEVPDPNQDRSGDSIADFLFEEVEQELNLRHERIEQQVTSSLQTNAKSPSHPNHTPQDSRMNPTSDSLPLNPSIQSKQQALDASQPHIITKQPSITTTNNNTQNNSQQSKPKPRIQKAKPAQNNITSNSLPKAFPTKLIETTPKPHLVIESVDEQGVQIGFDQQWLRHERFRMSFPMICVYTGHTDISKLIARPLIFSDHLEAGTLAPELAINYQIKRIHQQTPRQILKKMSRLDGVQQPYDHPIACYFLSDQAGILNAHTTTRPGGGVTCHVTIPHHDTALRWLAAVNGVCGPEHELLTAILHVSHYRHDSTQASHRNIQKATRMDLSGEIAPAAVAHTNPTGLQKLSTQDLKEINAWCKLEEGEHLQDYFQDAEHASDNPGNAGLAITNHRIVFHKYHRHGQADLNDTTLRLITKPDGNLNRLVLVTPHNRYRLIAMTPQDTLRLQTTLAKQSQITFEIRPNKQTA